MEKMSLKEFWDALEQRLEKCSGDDLRAVLRAMAQETPPPQRRAFLEKLKPVPPIVASAQKAVQQEDLLNDIDDLAEELEDELESGHERDEDYYHDEDSLGPYRDWVEPIAALFDRVQAAFDYGHLSLARKAYEKLFKLFGLQDDYGRGVSEGDLTNVDIGEARARYLRAVYETEPLPRRPQALFEQLGQVQARLSQPRPMLEDLLQISPKPLPDRDQFFPAWISFLRQQTGRHADAWLREATRLSEGTSGLENLARTEGKRRPRAYLDWLAALEREGKPSEVIAAAQAALRALPEKLPIRAAVADYLCTAATHQKKPDLVLAGRWEAFAAKPILPRLLDLWDAISDEEERTQRMQQAAQHIKDYLDHPPYKDKDGEDKTEAWNEREQDNLEEWAFPDKFVLAHAYLLAEDWNKAHQLAAGEKASERGYSHNPSSLVVPAFLILMSGKVSDRLPPNLARLWQSGLESSGFDLWRWAGAEGTQGLKRLERIYTDRLAKARLTPSQQKQFLPWCLEVARRQAISIVSQQQRKLYGQAAVWIAASAETLRGQGNGPEADALILDMRARFKQHRSFQAELNAAVGKSLTKGL